MSEQNQNYKSCPHCGENNWEVGWFDSEPKCLECGEETDISEINKPLMDYGAVWETIKGKNRQDSQEAMMGLFDTSGEEDSDEENDEEEQVEGRISERNCPETGERHEWHITGGGGSKGAGAPVFVQCPDCGMMDYTFRSRLKDYPGWATNENKPTDDD